MYEGTNCFRSRYRQSARARGRRSSRPLITESFDPLSLSVKSRQRVASFSCHGANRITLIAPAIRDPRRNFHNRRRVHNLSEADGALESKYRSRTRHWSSRFVELTTIKRCVFEAPSAIRGRSGAGGAGRMRAKSQRAESNLPKYTEPSISSSPRIRGSKSARLTDTDHYF